MFSMFCTCWGLLLIQFTVFCLVTLDVAFEIWSNAVCHVVEEHCFTREVVKP